MGRVEGRSLLTLREHEKLPYESLEDGEVARLEKLVADLKVKGGGEVLRFFRRHAQARQYVGILKAGERTVQILPKIYDEESQDLGFLVHLLAYTRKLALRQTGAAPHREFPGSLLEIWIRHFAEELNRLLLRHRLHSYVEVEERVGFLRGKLLVEKDLGGTGTLYARYPCRYALFTPDNLINRTLKFCNRLLLRETRVASTRTLLQQNDVLLADVEHKVVRPEELAGVHLDRLNRHYEPILVMCRLLLEGSTLDLRAGRITGLAFVFDMNVLFEEFVAEFLRRNKRRIRLRNGLYLTNVGAQKRLGRLFGSFEMRVDLILTDDDGRRFLVDTKYKLLEAASTHGGLSQVDFYQMFAYGRAGKEEYEDVVLLYPTAEGLSRDFEQDGLRLHVRQFDPRAIYDPKTGKSSEAKMIEQLSNALSFDALA